MTDNISIDALLHKGLGLAIGSPVGTSQTINYQFIEGLNTIT